MICTIGKELLVFQEIFVSGATENYYDKHFIYRVLSTQQQKRNSEAGDSFLGISSENSKTEET